MAGFQPNLNVYQHRLDNVVIYCRRAGTEKNPHIEPPLGAIEAIAWSSRFLFATGSGGSLECFHPEPSGLISPVAVIGISGSAPARAYYLDLRCELRTIRLPARITLIYVNSAHFKPRRINS